MKKIRYISEKISFFQNLSEKIIKYTNSSSEIVFKELPLDDPKQRKPDITLARNILGWEPKIEIMDGINLTFDYFKKVISG